MLRSLRAHRRLTPSLRVLGRVIPVLLAIILMTIPHTAMGQTSSHGAADACIREVPSGSSVTSDHTAVYPDGTTHSSLNSQCNNMVVPWSSGQYVDQVISTNGPSFSSMTAHWTVPAAPQTQSGQTLFFFDGFSPSGLSLIIQPVLAFGQAQYTCGSTTCTVGGNYWWLGSWEVYASPGPAYLSSIVNVNGGDQITGTLTWMSGGCGSYNNYYKIGAIDNTLNQETDLYACFGSQLTVGYVAVLEAWNINSCSQFPNQNQPLPHLDFTSISSSSTPTATWSGSITPAQPQCGYAADPMGQVHIHSYPTTDFYTRSHGLSLDTPLPNPWWPPYQSGYEIPQTSTTFDYYTTYVFGLAGYNHYVQEAASGFCPSYCWYSQIYINGALNAQANVDRSTPVQASFVDQWQPNARLYF